MTLVECKALLVEAHRAQDWEAAKRLSQVKQKLKRKCYCIEPGCGVRINGGKRCRLHEKRHRFYHRKLAV